MSELSRPLPSWNHEAYLNAKRQDRGRFMLQQLRDRQFANTLEVVEAGGYVTTCGMEIRLPDDSSMMENSVLYSEPNDFMGQEPHFEKEDTVYDVINDDCMAVTEQLVREGEPDGYRLKEEPVSFAVIAVAAVCDPELVDDMQMSERDAETTRCKRMWRLREPARAYGPAISSGP